MRGIGEGERRTKYNSAVLMEAESVLQDLARPHLVHIDPVLLRMILTIFLIYFILF